MARKKLRSNAQKRAVDANGIVHGFKERKERDGITEAVTFCGIALWEEVAGPLGAWKIVATRGLTCIACLGS